MQREQKQHISTSFSKGSRAQTNVTHLQIIFYNREKGKEKKKEKKKEGKTPDIQMQEMHTCFPGAQGAGGLWVSPARETKQDPI